MRKYRYLPINDAPTNGTPIIGVCGNVEMAVAYDNGPIQSGWFYWDEEDGGITSQLAAPQPHEWRRLF